MNFSLKVKLFFRGMKQKVFGFFRRRVFLDFAAGVPEGNGFWKLVPLWERIKVSCSAYGNPESFHSTGVAAKKALDEARVRTARFFGVLTSQVFFTKGGTESCSVYIQGVVLSWKKEHPGIIPTVITSSVEHSAVYETLRVLKERGEVELVYLSVQQNGVTDISRLKQLLSEKVALVTCMIVNNELGTLQPVRDIGRTIREYRKESQTNSPLFHCDAIQAAPYIDCAPSHYYADAISIGGSKLGIGSHVGVLVALDPSRIEPVILGGQQEKGLFPGSLQTKLVVKLGLVLQALLVKREKISALISRKREYMKELILRENKEAVVFDAKHSQAPHILTVWIPGISGEEAVIRLDVDGICASPQAACADPSRDSRIVREVMKAKSMKESDLVGQVRFSFGLCTNKKEIARAVKAFQKLYV
jgi:cysteine desulfurase